MTEKKKPPQKDEDEAQSARFIETAKALEADGELSLTEGERAFDRLVGKALPQRKRSPTR